ncbi:N-myristoyl transferase [Cylindrobasidium torrendii FP15055 ss-10]|uniref:Glycylpeptide N-tetradecanoyltransferase n=1 Tax=Cylindrobasidium torrendii FP15055 ss-10 TaxID=1314674 RepID=A0A0D7BPD9_9AGAR|nr:N-myristoyl transferase [Cylindrobasidium torrendii FP15055 ss-10]
MLSALKGSKEEIPDELVSQVLGEVRARGDEEAQNANAAEIRQALETMKIMDVVRGKAGLGGHNLKDMGEHKFWSTQPVPQLGEGPPIDDGYIEPPVPRDQVQQEGYTLPKDFEWSTIDINDPNQLKEVYDLLSLHYVEDHDASFRFQYTADFLRWALAPPGYFKEWHVGVRVKSNKKLVGFIAGVPLTIRVRKNVFVSCEINYLCVHKKLRSKRLAPMLIKEVTRRVHLEGIFQAIYTAGTVVPTPVSVCRYNHRPLNTSKLVSIRFSFVPRTTTLARMIRTNKLPDALTLPIREMEERDVEGVANLFAQYMTRFDMIPHFNLDEVKHQFLSGRGTGDVVHGRREGQVTWTYVAEDPETHKITDFFSFYSLPSTVIGNTEYPVLEAAYLYYYASSASWEKSKEEYKQHLKVLMGDALIVADKARFDVFNALTLMDNVEFLSDLKFGKGDGYLNFYLYNWRTAALAGMEAIGDREAGRGVGVVML